MLESVLFLLLFFILTHAGDFSRPQASKCPLMAHWRRCRPAKRNFTFLRGELQDKNGTPGAPVLSSRQIHSRLDHPPRLSYAGSIGKFNSLPEPAMLKVDRVTSWFHVW